MEPEPTVLDSLRRAVEAMPDDVPLRLHLATLLLRGGERDEAVRQLGAVLQRDPGNAAALGLLREGPAPAGAPGQPSPVLRTFRPNGPWCVPPPPARRGLLARPHRTDRRSMTGRRPRMSCATCCPPCSSATPRER